MTDDHLTAFLDAVDTSAAQLRPQRRWGCGDCGEWEDPDAIAAADALGALVGMVRTVLALHVEVPDMARVLNYLLTPGERNHRSRLRPGDEMGANAQDLYVAHGSPTTCKHCHRGTWPCPTVAALLAAIPPTPTAEKTR